MNCLICEKQIITSGATKYCSIKCYAKARLGKPNLWNLGKKRSDEQKLLKSINSIGKKNPNYRGGEEIFCLYCKKNKVWVCPSRKNKKFCSLQCSSKYRWSQKVWREKNIYNNLQKLMKRPTSLERQMKKIIKKYNLPYRYTGDGSFLIGFKNPDFVNINGEKKLIEVAFDFFKIKIYGSIENYIQQRKEHFAKYGWESYFFITKNNELNEEEILKTIR